MMDYKISIVVPVYNVAQYLEDCLTSIACQTYQNYEVLLVDDGSTDNSPNICDVFAKQDDRFRVVHQPNQGAAIAKNTGLAMATGDYIAFLDSDDFVENNWLERVVSLIKANNVDVIEYAFDKIYVGMREVDLFPKDSEGEFSAEEYLGQYLSFWQCSLFWNKVFCADLLKNVRFKNERRCIDDEFFTYKAVSSAKKIMRINDVLYHYRQRGSSAVSNPKNNMQKAKDALDILQERYLWIKQHYPNLTKVYLKHDVEALIDFSKRFTFDKAGVKLFKILSKYYMKECIKNRMDRVTLFYAFTNVFVAKRKLKEEKTSVDIDVSNYFA